MQKGHLYIYIISMCVLTHILYTFIKNDGFAFYIMAMFNCQRVAMWLLITPHLLFSSVAAHPFWGTTSFYLCCLKLEILWCSNIPYVDVRRFPWTPISVLKKIPYRSLPWCWKFQHPNQFLTKSPTESQLTACWWINPITYPLVN